MDCFTLLLDKVEVSTHILASIYLFSWWLPLGWNLILLLISFLCCGTLVSQAPWLFRLHLWRTVCLFLRGKRWLLSLLSCFCLKQRKQPTLFQQVPILPRGTWILFFSKVGSYREVRLTKLGNVAIWLKGTLCPPANNKFNSSSIGTNDHNSLFLLITPWEKHSYYTFENDKWDLRQLAFDSAVKWWVQDLNQIFTTLQILFQSLLWKNS